MGTVYCEARHMPHSLCLPLVIISQAFIILGHLTQLGSIHMLDTKSVWIQGSLCN